MPKTNWQPIAGMPKSISQVKSSGPRSRVVKLLRFFPVLLASVIALLAPSICKAQKIPPSTYQELRWRMIGPFRGGRARAAAGVPDQANVFYVGQGNGGVWKSDDYGRTWNPIFDDEPTQSIGAIAVAPSDPNIVYVASGEGLQRPDLSVGDGIYKSTDAGKTWTHLHGVLDNAQQIPALVVDPHDANRLFAAVLGHPYDANPERGVFRSTDGGQNWERVLYKDENTGGSDVEIDPSAPNIIYATLWQARQGPWEDGNSYGAHVGGIFKSRDGGATWQQLSKGLPSEIVQAYVAISPSETNRLYATIATPRETGGYGSGTGLGIYRSDDAGANWYQVTTDPRPAERIGGGDLPVPKVDSKNPDVLYSASIVTWRSADGGKTWTAFRGAPGGDDYQNIWINPNNPDVILLVGDQGALVTVNRGATWSSWYNQPTAQMYHAIADDQFPYRVYGGQQESGSVGISSRGNDGEITFRDWHPVGVIEYGYVAPDPLHPDTVYGAGRSEVDKFDWITGQVQNVTPLALRDPKYRTDRTEPIVFSPVDPHVLYYASNVLFQTTDGGNSWRPISPDLARPHPGIPASLGNLAAKDNADKHRGAIYALAPSLHDVNTIWAGTDDGMIWITRDGGASWKDIAPPALISWSKVTQISASHFDDQTAYASVSRFRIGDLHPFLYRTHDGGTTWKPIVTGLPDDAPVDTVREDPVRKGLLFVGTEKAVWVSFDDGDNWQSLQLNLPHTAMRDLWIHDDDLIVATHGRSFWILDDITPLRQLSADVPRENVVLFKPALAWRVRRDTNTDTPFPPDEPAGQNAPAAAVIDYFLAQAASGPVTLDVLDAKGALVRHYSSDDKPPMTQVEMEKTVGVPLYWLRPFKSLSAASGVHRWLWDLHYPTPKTAEYEYPIAAIPHDTPAHPLGPRPVPGQYTVRLTVTGHSYTAPLEVKMDPRVATSQAGLEAQFQAETDLAGMMNSGFEAAAMAAALKTGLQEQVDKVSGHAANPLAQAAAALQSKLQPILETEKTVPGAAPSSPAPPPTLSQVNAQLASLYGMVDNADAAPTGSQSKALATLKHDFSDVMARWNQLKNVDLPPFNKLLRDAGQPPLPRESQPGAPAESHNEE
jgi:photosystem II stability/assembly factor-like uncharacterized protein